MTLKEAVAKFGHARAQLAVGDHVVYTEWPQKTTDKDITLLPALVLAEVTLLRPNRNGVGMVAFLCPLHRYHVNGRSEVLWGNNPLQDRKSKRVAVDAVYFAAPLAERVKAQTDAFEQLLAP